MLSRRLLAVVSAVVLIGTAVPAHAGLSMNALNANALTTNALTTNAVTQNAVTQNAVTQNALANGGAAIADLNGVAVEAITLPQAIRH